MEKQEEEKLKAKYPNLAKGSGGSALLNKRLQKGGVSILFSLHKINVIHWVIQIIAKDLNLIRNLVLIPVWIDSEDCNQLLRILEKKSIAPADQEPLPKSQAKQLVETNFVAILPILIPVLLSSFSKKGGKKSISHFDANSASFALFRIKT